MCGPASLPPTLQPYCLHPPTPLMDGWMDEHSHRRGKVVEDREEERGNINLSSVPTEGGCPCSRSLSVMVTVVMEGWREGEAFKRERKSFVCQPLSSLSLGRETWVQSTGTGCACMFVWACVRPECLCVWSRGLSCWLGYWRGGALIIVRSVNGNDDNHQPTY